MFLPTSPRPPSGTMLHTPIGEESMALRRGSGEEARALEARADLRQLGLIRLDHRQPVPTDLVAGQVERGLDRDRVRLDPQELEGRLLFLVQRPRSLDVAVAIAADHLRDLRPPQMR